MAYQQLYLKKNEEKRLQKGHLWIYSNEIDIAKSPLKSFAAGEIVQVLGNGGSILGLAYINPHTLLAGRLLVRGNKTLIFDQSIIEQRLKRALALRAQLFDKPYYRLVYGESDVLPGLIVDRYADVLVVQITTAGMELLKTEIIAALQKVVKPQAILLRNDHGMRNLEGLPSYIETAYGTVPAQIELEENGVRFAISPHEGQKTGWFYDHRDNRAQLKRYVSGQRVLDIFSYVGGWSVQAAMFGAAEVWALDSSAKALDLLQHNTTLNGVADRVRTIQGDAFDQLKKLLQNKERFDVVIVDPPAFIKKQKDTKEGMIAYQRINEMALRLLRTDGYLITASCSQHLSKGDLQRIVLSSSMKLDHELQVIAQGHQAADHPVHPAIPETEYLKALFCRVGGKGQR